MEFGKWIKHDSGVQPVDDDVIVETIFDDGSGDVDRANAWSWDDGVAPMFYRIAQQEVQSASVNPKQGVGSSKLPLHLWPGIATAYGSVALANGLKYGEGNYKATPVLMSIYLAATLRHLYAFMEGQEYDEVDGTPHLGAILANIAIIIESRSVGTAVDDRQITGGYLNEIEALTEIAMNLKELHDGGDVYHYTIKDTEERDKKFKRNTERGLEVS